MDLALTFKPDAFKSLTVYSVSKLLLCCCPCKESEFKMIGCSAKAHRNKRVALNDEMITKLSGSLN